MREPCHAGGKHRWHYSKDRTRRDCQRCGTIQVKVGKKWVSKIAVDRGWYVR